MRSVVRSRSHVDDLHKIIAPMLLEPTSERISYIVDEQSAERFVIALIAKCAASQVSLGAFHVFRGILGLEGQSLRNIAEAALGYLNDAGALSFEGYQERLAALDQNVRSGGCN